MKKAIIIFVILTAFLALGLAYLNNVFLPKTARSIIIKAIEDTAHKKVTLGSLRVNIFKGIVLRDLIIYDEDKEIVNVKEASCVFWLWGLIHRKIVIPKINFKSCRVYLERRKDNTFNLIGLFPQKKEGPVGGHPKFDIAIYRVNIIDSTVNFKDNSLEEPFTQDLNNIDAVFYLSLPASLRFNASAQAPDSPNPNISLSGEYKLPQEELNAKVSIGNIPLNKFSPYYRSFGVGIKEGLADALISLKLKDSVLGLDCRAKSAVINANKEDISFNLKAEAGANIKYGLKDGILAYSGKAILTDSAISGLGFAESVNGINAAVNFDNNGLGLSGINASLDLENAVLKLNKVNDPLEEIKGRLEFTPGRLEAKVLSFKYQGTPCKLSLLVNNFQPPAVSLEVSSEGLLVKSDFIVDGQKVNISDLSGRYLGSDFKASGNFDTLSSTANLSGVYTINLEDLDKPLFKFKEQLDKAMPEGEIEGKFSFDGDIRDINGCEIEMRASSPRLSLYGLNGRDVDLYYSQEGGVASIPYLNFSFYGGAVKASARANLKSGNLPYLASLSMEGVKIEELKLDTGLKDKDISGIINAGINLNGSSNDLSGLSGTGKLAITKGKLWELDLFKGMGKLLFARDFAHIIFNEGSCDLVVQDKYIFTNNLALKSNISFLSGRVKLGFDGSIDASLNVDIIDEFVPLSGTLKDVTTAVIGKAGKFATISITGTLKEPKYKFQPLMQNIIRGLADTLKQAIRKEH